MEAFFLLKQPSQYSHSGEEGGCHAVEEGPVDGHDDEDEVQEPGGRDEHQHRQQHRQQRAQRQRQRCRQHLPIHLRLAICSGTRASYECHYHLLVLLYGIFIHDNLIMIILSWYSPFACGNLLN